MLAHCGWSWMALPQGQVTSHFFLWLFSLTNCFLQSCCPIYQLETDMKAWGLHPPLSPQGEQAAPVQAPGCPCSAPGPAAARGCQAPRVPGPPLCPGRPLPLGSSSSPVHPGCPGPPSLCCRLDSLLTFCQAKVGEKVVQSVLIS